MEYTKTLIQNRVNRSLKNETVDILLINTEKNEVISQAEYKKIRDSYSRQKGAKGISYIDDATTKSEKSQLRFSLGQIWSILKQNMIKNLTNKSLQNNDENGKIITRKMINRKIVNGVPTTPMDENLYKKIVSNLEKQGCKVIPMLTEDDINFMTKVMEAEAIYDNGHIQHLGKIPNASALYEEIIHMAQAREFGELEGGDFVELERREILANRKLLKYAKAYKLKDVEIEDIKDNLQKWENKYYERTGKKFEEN